MSHGYQSGREHVSEAIKVNAHRGDIYAAITSGKSRSLTRMLIAFERLSLLPLAFFDRWGRRYNRQGIPIIEADFVSMSTIKGPSAPLRLNGQATETHLRILQDRIKRYQAHTLQATAREDFLDVSHQSYELLQLLHALEEESESLFPMTRHMLESVGNAALNAATYAAQSNGKTVRLSKAFLRFHIRGMGLSIPIDKKAQACHALGAGIVENDIPHIPFEEAWRRRSNQPPHS